MCQGGDMEFVYASVTARGRPFFEKLEAVAEAGFDGITVSTLDYRAAQAEGHSDADIMAAIRGSGVDIACVGGATTWLTGTADENEIQTMDLAERLDCQIINCTPTSAPYTGLEDAARAFAAVCDRAARRGLRCKLEFVYGSPLSDLVTAWKVVQMADRPNGGLLVDNFHLFHSGGTFDELRSVPPERIFGVQLSDGPIDPGERDPRSGSFQRLLPGEGQLDVVGFVRTLEQMGAPAPYEAEPINRRWDEMPASVGMPMIRQAMADVVSAARSTPAG
jgi:sugar phosphate isomerase/epimerase